MTNFNRRTRDRRDIGQVVFPIEQLMAARALSSCCAGQEAMLETGKRLREADEDRDPLRTGAA